MKVVILMSTYNGEKFLKEQIDSIINQKRNNRFEIEILVRDDGSTDLTKEILDDYQSKDLLTWYEGPNLKPAKSFWNLVMNAPEADYYSFCDQDDQWFEDKILRALEKIGKTNIPSLYCSEVTVTDMNLNLIQTGSVNPMTYTDFSHSLIYSLAPGCTFVFNKAALDQLVRYDMQKETEVMHDWLAHKIIALKGNVIFDKSPTMYYRQHGNNTIGSQSGVASVIRRIGRFLRDKSCIRSSVASSMLRVYGNELSDNSDEFKYLNIVANYKTNGALKKAFLREKAFRKGGINDLLLNLLIRMERI